MGKVSLETPLMIEQEVIQVEEQIRLKAEKDEVRKKPKKKRRH